MKNPKNKGNSFERLIAKKLSLWWSFGKNDFVIWRTHSSGAMGSLFNKKNIKHSQAIGDLMSIEKCDLLDYFVFELKFYKEFSFLDMLLSLKKNKLILFWLKIKEEALKIDKIPVLIFKTNFKPIFIIINTDLFDNKMNILNISLNKEGIIFYLKKEHKYFFQIYREENLLVVLLDDFLYILDTYYKFPNR